MDSKKKKEILIHFVQILFGVLVIIPLLDETSWLRFLAFGGFLIIVINVIWFVKNSEEILYDIFPSRSIREKKPKFKDKIWGHISSVLFIVGLIVLVFQMGNIENMIEESDFWKKNALIGFCFSLLSLFLLNKFRPSVFYESGRRYTVIFGFLVGLTALIISGFSFLNINYASAEIVESNYTIRSKSRGGKKLNTHWVFITIEGSDKRFELSPKQWKQIEEGDTVTLKTQTGYLGYDFVTELNKVINN